MKTNKILIKRLLPLLLTICSITILLTACGGDSEVADYLNTYYNSNVNAINVYTIYTPKILECKLFSGQH